MIPFILGGLFVAGITLLLDDNESDKETQTKKSTSSSDNKTILEKNFYNLRKQLYENISNKKVLIIGQPGAGKSSLLLKITEDACIPKPHIGVHTDATNWHKTIKNDFLHKYEGILFVDSPGYDTKSHPVDSYVNHFPFASFDIIIFVIKGKIHSSDQKIMSTIKKVNKSKPIKLILIRGFSENLNSVNKADIEKDIEKYFQNDAANIDFIFSSNRTSDGIDMIQQMIYR